MQVKYAEHRKGRRGTDPYLTGWGPTPRSRRVYGTGVRTVGSITGMPPPPTSARRGEHPALVALRVTAYVLASLACLTYLALTVVEFLPVLQ